MDLFFGFGFEMVQVYVLKEMFFDVVDYKDREVMKLNFLLVQQIVRLSEWSLLSYLWFMDFERMEFL